MVKTETHGANVHVQMTGDPNLVMKECAVTCAALLKDFRNTAVEKGADPATVDSNLRSILAMVDAELFPVGPVQS